eukprot:CAMPEP_0116990648 /NCGR_PEP_ID=MMETSP0467-20121206/65612_1 /TAXON_ID=283647 /ORGANISM="Mesodinium pulex, Strain SPMC105" /LENGTH=163 /DNA_ID=CAMNT_0004687469 /DNA_START=77 /DNA_END=565 /DNA_ORIENTATION=-
MSFSNSEQFEQLSCIGGCDGSRGVLNDVESDGLGEGSASADEDDVSDLAALESRGEVRRDVGVALLVSLVLVVELEVALAHDHGVGHLVGDDHALDQSAVDGCLFAEGTLVVDEGVLSVLRGLHAQSDVFDLAGALGAFVVVPVFVVSVRVQCNAFLSLESSW